MQMGWKTALALSAIILLAGCVQQGMQPAATPTAVQQQMVRVTLGINGPQNSTLALDVEKGAVLFDVLQRNAQIEYKTYEGMGALVTSINGLEQNKDGNGRYWQYYVDGTLGSVGVSAYRIEKNESIEFRYEKISPALGG